MSSTTTTDQAPKFPIAEGEHFSDGVDKALEDETLQKRLAEVLGLLRKTRNRTIPHHTATDEVRRRGKLIRAEVIAHLDQYMEQFIERATARGIEVHVARTPEDARRIVLDLAKKHGVRRVTKGKSMVSEECGIRESLEEAGMEVTETDLGELMVQLARQPPSHLIAPAIHMSRKQMAEVLSATAGGKKLSTDPKVLMRASREWLRSRFLEADMGITGVNFGIAETGTFFIVTNEGNGRLTSTLPKIHVAMMGIERLLPTLQSVPTILELLVRAGTGQRLSVYTSFFGGPRKANELHGPEEQHIVLVDNGRSKLLGTEFAEALECIRCGACLNVCPVYEKAGGHVYRATYGGPIGQVVTPLYGSSPISNELPHASSLCGACKEACPVQIDIPNMLIKLRRVNRFAGPLGRVEGIAISIASHVLASPSLYRLSAAVGRKALRGRDGWVRQVPGPMASWTLNRDLPAFAKKTFRERWAKRRRR